MLHRRSLRFTEESSTGYGLKFLPKTKVWQNIILPTESKSKIEPPDIRTHEGIALSDLRPSGKATFNDKIFDVQTQGEYIKKGEKVKIISIKGNIIIVRKV